MRKAALSMNGTRIAWLLLALVALGNGGCLVAAAGAAAGAGAAGYAYYKGKVCEAYSASFDDTWAAAKTALTELQMPLVGEDRETTTTGVLKSQLGDGTPVRLTLHTEPSPIPAEKTVTRVCVRVATFGDPGLSDRILNQVAAHLAPVGVVGSGGPPQAVAQPNQPWGPVQPPPLRPQPLPSNLPPSTQPPPLLPPEPVTKTTP